MVVPVLGSVFGGALARTLSLPPFGEACTVVWLVVVMFMAVFWMNGEQKFWNGLFSAHPDFGPFSS